jgi:SAM-dependent methyltransferase
MIERTRCPLCQGGTDVVFARPFSLPPLQAMLAPIGLDALAREKSFQIRYCPECELGFQSWVLEETEAERALTARKSAEDLRAEIAGQKLHALAHPIEEVLVLRQVCAERAPAVLDFGCAWGKWAGAALALGCEVWGVELNAVAAAFCSGRGLRMVSRDELQGLRFDFINVDQVLEHVSDPLELSRELCGCLKPGGLLKLSTPGNARLLPGLRAAERRGDNSVLQLPTLDALYPLEHVNLFNRRSLLRAGAAAGLVRYRVPWLKSLGAGQLWNLPRQLNRNLTVPFKRWLGWGTYQWFRAAAA